MLGLSAQEMFAKRVNEQNPNPVLLPAHSTSQDKKLTRGEESGEEERQSLIYTHTNYASSYKASMRQ